MNTRYMSLDNKLDIGNFSQLIAKVFVTGGSPTNIEYY